MARSVGENGILSHQNQEIRVCQEIERFANCLVPRDYLVNCLKSILWMEAGGGYLGLELE